MRIVVLDGYTLNPGDLSWKDLEALGQCSIYDRTPAEWTIQRADGAEIVLTNKTVLSAEVIERLEALKYISVLATGYNIVDIEAARKRGIAVSNVPIYGTESVAQMVFAHILNLTQNVAHHAQTVRNGRWCTSPDFCYWDMSLIELQGSAMGIIGFGRIGQATARLALAFGMKVIIYDIVTSLQMPEGPFSVAELPTFAAASAEWALRRMKCRMVELNDIFRLADVVSLHCPLTDKTEKLVNEQRLALMKPTAFLINTSRGPLIDEQALADALNNGKLAGAGLDVLAVEPPNQANPLLKAKNCYITPHIAWATRAARQRLLKVTVDNVAAFLAARPQNVVNHVEVRAH